jgi:hypothetical protein
MQTGPDYDDAYFLPMSYLSLYADNASTPSSFLLFIPKETLTVKSPLLRKLVKEKEEILSFPFEFDRCSHPPVAGLRFTNPPLTICELRRRGVPGYIY